MAGKLKSLDAKKFVPMLSARQERFNIAKPVLPEISDQAAVIARSLHPKRQYLKISSIIQRTDDCKSFILVPDTAKGTESLAYFGAGKYLTVFEKINGMSISRPYSISSSPNDSLNGFYTLTVRLVEGGIMSRYIFDNWTVGTQVEVSAPAGNFEYQPLRDAEKVIGIAGGSGITPFISMANAVKDGDEDFELLILYGSKSADSVLFKDELDELCAKCEKIKVVHVISDENFQPAKGFVKGFITSELIKKYAPDNAPYSIFVCGSAAMYDYVDKEIEKLNLEKKYIRHELFGEFRNPSSQPDYPSDILETVSITVTIQDETKTVTGSTSDTVLQILEKNGISAPARCRSGECGFCHSHLISGEVYIPKSIEYRRMADLKFGCIHPCCSFPLTDLIINVPAAK